MRGTRWETPGGPLLPQLTSEGRLPPGRHRATFQDVHDRFVASAPFSQERELVFRALVIWAQRVWSIFPDARLWVDGGFVTHKEWAAPKDVDVTCIVRSSNVLSVDDATLATLLTHRGPDGARVQPMGGLVDGFLACRGVPEDITRWDAQWSRVLDEERREIEGARKGYVEVINGE